MKNKYALRLSTIDGKLLLLTKEGWIKNPDRNDILLFVEDEANIKKADFIKEHPMFELIEVILMEGTMELGVSILGKKVKGMTPKDSDWNGEVK